MPHFVYTGFSNFTLQQGLLQRKSTHSRKIDQIYICQGNVPYLSCLNVITDSNVSTLTHQIITYLLVQIIQSKLYCYTCIDISICNFDIQLSLSFLQEDSTLEKAEVILNDLKKSHLNPQ